MRPYPRNAMSIVTHVDRKEIKRIHLLGVCGTGMGSFAGMLAAQGFTVTGSDENVYPPMSEMLEGWGVRAMLGYKPENLDEAKPDLVIVGNVIRQVNPEATAMRERGLPHMSFPAALGELCIGDKHSLVVAGTHGKTTTTAMLAHVLSAAGRDPSMLVGGVALNFGANFKVGAGEHFVVEGDEYDTAYFDKGPKFLHYRPRSVIFTSLEFDHADIYRDMAHYCSSFEKLVALVPEGGYLAVCAAYPKAVEIARACRGRVETYAGAAKADWQADVVEHGARGAFFDVVHGGAKLGRVNLAVGGPHNVENALGVIAVATSLGLSIEEIGQGLASFCGVKRRQELRGEPGGIFVIDDFAHHPTAVRETIAAIGARYPGQRLWAIFEPRSNTSRRNIHQAEYAHAFAGASRAVIATPLPTDRVPANEMLDVRQLAKDITANGVPATAAADVAEIVALVKDEARPGDVLLIMSNGAFGGLIDKLLVELR
ncbi:MAG: UDP-N-acetylmuramate:L-alanyl-gamma-D-glutamyl-meso-diaminopimelate ligase [Myxococcales bacterium]|jgi:UDP-N-acetylmuramate: L-alanyl-gamma-D-glutamyl-meso-diaminopimelate ligase